ncbi:hypothetical protein B0H14DRAFT_1343026 [Mycena olivaceomarginata]|nr:hypothetical protein B0H14DRAFT_1343026 [Mycena olivaceomarginata]
MVHEGTPVPSGRGTRTLLILFSHVLTSPRIQCVRIPRRLARLRISPLDSAKCAATPHGFPALNPNQSLLP